MIAQLVLAGTIVLSNVQPSYCFAPTKPIVQSINYPEMGKYTYVKSINFNSNVLVNRGNKVDIVIKVDNKSYRFVEYISSNVDFVSKNIPINKNIRKIQTIINGTVSYCMPAISWK